MRLRIVTAHSSILVPIPPEIANDRHPARLWLMTAVACTRNGTEFIIIDEPTPRLIAVTAIESIEVVT